MITRTSTRTIQATPEMVRRARRVYDAQNAVNSCGLSYEFREDLVYLLVECELGTDSVNQHPLTVLWIDKFASLAHCQAICDQQVMSAYAAVECLMSGQDAEWAVIPMR